MEKDTDLKLFEARLEFTFYVAAKDANEADRIASENARQAIKDECGELNPSIYKARSVLGYEADIPYTAAGANPDNLTCIDILTICEEKEDAAARAKAEWDANLSLAF